jgi:hypothetical protein
MSGTVHLRIVVAVFVVGGIAALVPYGLALFSDDIDLFPFGWAGGIGSIALAVWLSRGSNIARVLLVVVSVFGVLIYGYLFVMVLSHSWAAAAVLGAIVVLSGYSLWALAFSQTVRAELARRDVDAKQKS